MIYTETRRIQDNQHKSWRMLPQNIIGNCMVLQLLQREGLHLENWSQFTNLCQTTKIDQTITLPWKNRFELLNRSTDGTTFRFKKESKLSFSQH